MRPESATAPCYRLVALSPEGVALVEEPGPEGRQYHLQRRLNGRLETATLTEQACRQQGRCDDSGPKLGGLGLAPAASFLVTDSAAPAEASIDLPEVGASKLQLAQVAPDGAGWAVSVVQPGGASRELFRTPPDVTPSQVQWYRAGPYLWSQLETGSDSRGCFAVGADLREVASAMLDDEAVALLEADRRGEALATLQRAYAMNPDDSTVAYNLACAYALDGEGTDAMAWLSRALKLDRDSRLVKIAQKDPDLDALRMREDFQALIPPEEAP